MPDSAGPQRFVDLFLRSARSRARRAAVRFRAAASDAFFARALRSSAVIFFAAFFPPWLPYAFPNLHRYLYKYFRRDALSHARIVAANGGKVIPQSWLRCSSSLLVPVPN